MKKLSKKTSNPGGVAQKRETGMSDWIKAAAVRCGDEIFIGRDHGSILKSKLKIKRGEQGFVTNTDEFVGREIAAVIAFTAGQISKWQSGRILLSEELWSDGPYMYDEEQGYVLK